MREIKFEFMYTNGALWIRRAFNLAEIMNGEPFEVISDSPLLRDYKMVAERQYTGLKDCDGVEMYQNDICTVEGLGVVIVDISEYYGAVFVDKDGCDYPVVDSIAEGDKFKVIGNIHQNPELLK